MEADEGAGCTDQESWEWVAWPRLGHDEVIFAVPIIPAGGAAVVLPAVPGHQHVLPDCLTACPALPELPPCPVGGLAPSVVAADDLSMRLNISRMEWACSFTLPHELPTDRREMRRLVSEKLQAAGDVIMQAWEERQGATRG